MNKVMMREVKLIETDLALDCGSHRHFYGILVSDNEYVYENKFISTNCNQVKYLIHKIEVNLVENIHIQNVVEDFIAENNLA